MGVTPFDLHAGGEEKSSAAVFARPAPQNTAELRQIQQAAQEAAKKVAQCTVGLQVGPAQGSGVIISEDGYILTAAHVSGRPGRLVQVLLPDGTRLRGKSLGVHTLADGALVKITDQGKWPFVPLVPAEDGPEVGDWCLATGHPNGFDTKRTAPLRLGRIIDLQENVIRTDCPLMGGDSGGPLVDIQGRVIGIHSRISHDVTINLHAPVLACLKVWDELKAGQVHPATPRSRFLNLLDKNGDGKLTRGELPEGYYRRVFDRLAKQFQLDPEKAHPIEELTKSFDWRASTFPMLGLNYQLEERLSGSLMRKLYVRGSKIRKPFQEVAAEVGKSVVRIQSGGKQIGLGMVVDADGWILTKASELDGPTKCKLADGREFTAQLVGVEKPYDLAVLRIDAKNLKPVQWANASELKVGNWVITPGSKNAVESVGVMSVAAREIVAIPGVLGVQIFVNEEEARIERVFPGSGAEEAGMKTGDVITHLFAKEVANINELKEALKNYRAADVVKATVNRQGQSLKFEVTLGAPADVFAEFLPRGRRQLNGPLSRRRDGFPLAIQHDSVLAPNSCGGPLVNLAGKVVGVNVARADRIATYAAPSEAIQSLLAKYVQRETANSQ